MMKQGGCLNINIRAVQQTLYWKSWQRHLIVCRWCQKRCFGPRRFLSGLTEPRASWCLGKKEKYIGKNHKNVKARFKTLNFIWADLRNGFLVKFLHASEYKWKQAKLIRSVRNTNWIFLVSNMYFFHYWNTDQVENWREILSGHFVWLAQWLQCLNLNIHVHIYMIFRYKFENGRRFKYF